MSPSRLARLLGVSSLALLVACATTLPERGRLAMRDVEFPLRDFALPSGLRIVVERDTRNPVVAVVAVVGAGSSADPAGKEGLAHVVEHLAFRARHGGSTSVWTRLEGLGAGRFNASTGLDATTYMTLAPRESLAALLQLEVRRLSAPLDGVTPHVFAVEREVVRNELRQRNETGYVGQVFSWAQAAAFPAGHPYARPVVGTHPSLSAMRLEDAQAFVRQHYRPDNVTLVITGDVDLATVDQLLEAALPAAWVGEGPPAAAPAPRLAEASPAPPLAPVPAALPTYEAAVATPELYLTWTLPRGFDEASAVHSFVRAALERELGGAFGDDEDISGVSTTLVPGTQASLLVVRVMLATGEHPQRSAEAVLDQVHRAWSRVGEGEVKQSQARFAQRHRAATVALLLENEDVLARAEQRAELAHFTREAGAFNRTQRALGALRPQQVADFTFQWLKRDRARVIHVRPGAHGAPALADVRPLPADVAATVPATLTQVEALRRVPPVHRFTLPTGLEVVLAPRPGIPLVTVAVAVAGGSASVGDAPGVPEVATALSRQSSWTGDTSDWGLQSSRWLLADHTRYTLAGPAGNLANMLAMLGERLGNTRLGDPRVLELYRRYAMRWRTAQDARPETQAQHALSRALYGATSPYGRAPSAEDLGRVTVEQAEAWLAKVHRPGNAVAVIAGEFDPAEAEALARTHLGTWTSEGAGQVRAPAAALPAPRERPEVLVTARPGATQGQLTLACRLEDTGAPALARHEVMAEVVHERLWRTVRQQAGASYGFHAGVATLRGGAAHLEVQGVVDAGQLAPSLAAARAALALPDGAAGEAEVARARARLQAQHAVALTTSARWAHALAQAHLRGWAPEDVARRAEHLAAVDAAAVQADLAACAGRLVVGITADEGAARVAAGALE